MARFLIAIIIAALALPTWARGPHHSVPQHHHYHSGSNWSWLAPAIIGGAVVYSMTRPVYAYPPQPPIVVYQNSLPPAPFGYHYEQILDSGCNCVRWVLIAN